ncbi:uncharacterized protein LOC144175700 isoform X2 [Haemaphysalis longicornis]
MALLPNKVYWCSQSEDDSEEGFYVGNIVPARVLLLAVLGRLPVSPVLKALPGPPLANHLLDLSCGRPSLGALYASPPGKAIPLSVTWHQVTRHTPSKALLPFSAPIDYVLAGGIFKKKCFVVCEQIELFGEGMDFTEAMCVEFLLYYVFNMVYPGSVATTLEFIQRQLFNINPLSGTKCDGKRKSRTSVNVKVMKLA